MESALRNARDAIRLDPRYADAHFNAGCALQGLKDHTAAILAYQKAIQLQPDFLKALVNLGFAYLELDRAPEAITPLKQALELRPECVEAHDFLGVAYLKTGDRTAAMGQASIVKNLDAKFESTLSRQLASEDLNGK